MILWLFLLNLSALKCSLPYVSIEPLLLLLECITLYYLYRLASSLNTYQLIGYGSLVLMAIACYLFYLQFDVFACFLLISESIVMLFALSILLHLNYNNYSVSKPQASLLFVIAGFTCCNTGFTSNSFGYWVDWYCTQSSAFNDLVAQFLYFYVCDQWVSLLVALWLLVITLLLVQLILGLSLRRCTDTTSPTYTRKTQSIWDQWYKKPVTRFFQK